MTRNEFLKRFGMLGLASSFVSNLLASCMGTKHALGDIPDSYPGKVVIVGAGVAGITAAHILHTKNIDYEVLEATSVHGGRIKKNTTLADFPIDLGAEWIHTWIHSKPPMLQKLLEGTDPKFPTFKDTTTQLGVWKKGRYKEKKHIQNPLGSHDLKFSHSTWFDFFDQFVVPFLKERIHYNSPVNEIDYRKEKVVLKTASSSEYIADKVLITVPIKILQQKYIEFVPSIPSDQMKSINNEWMADGLKVFVKFSERFYPEVLFFEGIMKSIFQSNYMYYDVCFGKETKDNILGLFAVGDPAQKYLSLKDDNAIINYIIKELDEIFEGKASLYYIDHCIQNWSSEPFIQGAYSYGKGNVEKMAAPLQKKIYFAGEAMNVSGNTIAVHAACESSYLALGKMLKE